MALFKIYGGTKEELTSSIPVVEGRAYFLEDTGEFFIDTAAERKQLTTKDSEYAEKAAALYYSGGAGVEIEIPSTVYRNAAVIKTVSGGGNALYKMDDSGAQTIQKISIKEGTNFPSGTAGQIVGFDASGNPVAQAAPNGIFYATYQSTNFVQLQQARAEGKYIVLRVSDSNSNRFDIPLAQMTDTVAVFIGEMADGKIKKYSITSAGVWSNEDVADYVISFNNRGGEVAPQAGDYTADMVGAYSIEDVNKLVCRKNLLDNWYFGNPVNQRGQTSYTGSSYTIDRWRITGVSSTLKVVNGGITFTPMEASNGIRQVIDSPKMFAGKTVTISISLGNANGVKARVGYIDGTNHYGEWGESGIITATGTVAESATNFTVFIQLNTVSESPIILAAKLELGTQQTLAHQDEDGNWVLNDLLPDKGMELLRCVQSTADPSDTYANKVVATQDWAVCKAGDTMTGALLNTIDSIGRASFVGAQPAAYFESFRSDYNIRRQIVLQNIEENPNDANALFMWNSTSNKISTILHTGNKDQIFTYGTADMTAGSSALETGKLYFVYE